MDGEVGSGPLHWAPALGPQVPETAGQWTQGSGTARQWAVAPRRRPWRIVYWVTFGLLCAAFVGLFTGFLMTFGIISTGSSVSMEPGIGPGDLVNYQRGASDVVRGDVVVLRVPGVGMTVKRVIGLPGDHVACCDSAGRVTVDGKALDEGYLPSGYAPGPTDRFQVAVGAGQVWVMGDNRAVSLDSREWGPLPESDIAGRAEMVVRPGGGQTVLSTPLAFTAAGLAPADHRDQFPFLLLGFALFVLAAIVVQGTAGIIASAVRRRKRRLRYRALWHHGITSAMTPDCLANRRYPMGAEMSAMRRRWISKATPARARGALIVFIFIAVTAAAAGCSHAPLPASTPAPGHTAVAGTDGAGKRTADTARQQAAWSGPGLRPPAPLAPFSGSPAAPRVAWRPSGRRVDGVPAVYETSLIPPGGTRPAGLAWMDTQLLAARLYSGSASPGGTSWKLTAPIQAAQADTLVAAFNGGFKMADAHGGYYSEGRMAYPLVRGAASLVIYAGGSVTVGAWGTDVAWSRSIVAVRQNLVPLVAGGRPTAAAGGNWYAWGNTCGAHSCAASVPEVEHQWRSGVGVTANGALVYALGPDLDPLQLAQLLVRAGVVRGMELDINPSWPVFASYAPASNGRAAPSNGSSLLATMQGPTTFFDPGWTRDFITMSAR